MLGFVTRLVRDDEHAPEESESADTVDETDATVAPDGPNGRPRARLYECPDCESVYLSADLSACRSCETSVERVATERDLGFGTAENR